MYRKTGVLSIHKSSNHVESSCLNTCFHPTEQHVSSAPETFDIVSETVDVAARKNLAQISRVLTQIASGSNFNDDSPAYIPINDFVLKATGDISAWLLEGECDNYKRCTVQYIGF